MINSCKQHYLCDNVYSYLIFVLYMYFTELIKRLTLCYHQEMNKNMIDGKKANDCGCNNLFIYSSRYY